MPFAATVIQPPYFAVSPSKFLVLSLCTFGLYEFFWVYWNWKLIKEREQSGISPFWRTFFGYIFCYALLSRVKQSADDAGVSGFAAGPLTAGWIALSLLWKLPDPWWLVCFLATVFLLPVQATVNRINALHAPGHDPNDGYSRWNVATVAIGGLLLILAIVGTFLPPENLGAAS
jgi:hypothetical protein